MTDQIAEQVNTTTITDGYCALARVRPIDGILAIQEQLRAIDPTGQFTIPDDLHITIVYASGGDVQKWQEALRGAVGIYSVIVDGIGIFDTPDGYAMHLTLRSDGTIFERQEVVYNAAVAAGFIISEYSLPNNYKPHITLGYFSKPVEPFEIEPFSLAVDEIELTAPDHSVVEAFPLRSEVSPKFDPRLYIRSVGEQGEIEGYICIWGDSDHRDSYGTWFDRNAPPDLALEYLPQPMYYEHGQDGALRKDRIGKVVQAWVDKVGIKFRGVLDTASQYFGQMVNEIKQGMLATSSGTAAHLAEFDDEGRFVNWPLAELSLTKSPAEERMPLVSLVRSNDGRMYAKFTGNTEVDKDDQQGGGSVAGDRERSDVRPIVTNVQSKPRSKRTMLTLEQLGIQPSDSIDAVMSKLSDAIGPNAAKAMLNDLMGGATAAPADDPEDQMEAPEMLSADAGRSKKPAPQAPAENQDFAAMRKQLDDLQKKIEAEPPADKPQVRSEQVSVAEPGKLRGLSDSDMRFAYMVMRGKNIQPSEDFMRVFGGRTATAIEKNEKTISEYAVRSAIKGIRANEIAISTASGGGDEWVKIAYATEVWLAARNETIIDQIIAKGMMVKEVPAGAESVDIPTEGADPTVYTIAQNGTLSSNRPPVNVGVTRIGTGNVVLTPGEVGAAVAWSDVFEEDSIVNVSSQYNYQINKKLIETIDQLFINGDPTTGASANINLIDGTPGTALSTPYYIASGGALFYALVTGSGTSRDGGTLDETDYRLTLKLMSAAVRTRFKELAFIIDADTHSASLDIAAIKTDEVRRTNATITSGVLTNIFGVDVLPSGLMPTANSSGKVPAAGAALGRILAVYAPYWGMGWKRHIKIESDRDILTGDNIVVAKMRVGFKPRGADAATVTYDLTV